MRVLLIKTSSMGDILHTLPALTDAIQTKIGISFDWVIEEGFAQIPSWHPAVAQVIPVAIRRWRKSWFSAATRLERQHFKQRLQSQRYDAIIDAQGLLKSAGLITRLARGAKHGLDWRSAREPLASLFYNYSYRINRSKHAIERNRCLFANSLHYPLPLKPGDYAIADQLRKKNFTHQRPYLVFLHATTRDEKHWPERYWHELISHMADAKIDILLPWGSTDEQQRAIRLAQGFTHVHVLPKLTLEQLATVLTNAQAVVSVDTGLSHLAAALGRPNITLYGPTDPALIGGYGANQVQLRSADRLMASTTPTHVMQELKIWL